MPRSTALRTMRMASVSLTLGRPRWCPPSPIADTRSPVRPSTRTGTPDSERGIVPIVLGSDLSRLPRLHVQRVVHGPAILRSGHDLRTELQIRVTSTRVRGPDRPLSYGGRAVRIGIDGESHPVVAHRVGEPCIVGRMARERDQR